MTTNLRRFSFLGGCLSVGRRLLGRNLFFSLFKSVVGQLFWHKIYLLYSDLFSYDSNELKVLRFLLKTLKLRGNLFLDVGSCQGGYAFALSNNFSEVVAFEPDGANAYWIQRDAKLRRKSNIVVVQKAVSKLDGQARFWKGPTIFTHSLVTGGSGKYSVVDVVSLNSFVKSSVDLVKVDVQGVAVDVVKGATLVMDKIKRWVIELELDELRRKEELQRLMESFNYETRWLSEQHLYASR